LAGAGAGSNLGAFPPIAVERAMNPALSLLGLLLCTASGATSAAEAFRCRAADGSLAFQDRPCAASATALGRVAIVHADADGVGAAQAAREEQARIDAWAQDSRDRLAPSLGGRAGAARSTHSSARQPRASAKTGATAAEARPPRPPRAPRRRR
jgi:hypothetical protein